MHLNSKKLAAVFLMSLLLMSCATVVETDKITANALPQKAALNYIHNIQKTYPAAESKLWVSYKCEIDAEKISTWRPKAFSSKWVKMKEFSVENAYYEPIKGAPGIGTTILISKKGRLLPGGYSENWCHLYAGKKIDTDTQADEVAQKVATALESLGIQKK